MTLENRVGFALEVGVGNEHDAQPEFRLIWKIDANNGTCPFEMIDLNSELISIATW